MKLPVFLILLTVGFFLQAKEAKPNIILLMGDDHGWEEVGYNGHTYVKTPNLDEMATEGLRLDNFYAQPTCSPTRGSVLTGRHPNRYGIFRPGYSIRPKEITIAHLLKEAGYATAHFGKWHVGPVKQSSPTSPGAMGFEHWLSHDNFFEMNPVFSLNGRPPKKIYGESSEILIDEAMKYIDNRKDSEQPFLLVIWYGSPHEPYSAFETDLELYRDLPEKYSENQVSLTSNETGLRVKRPQRDVLIERYAEITAMDRSIGKLRNGLRTLGIKDNTLLWYCGDNGTPPSGLRESRFRGVKGKVYENGIRVPSVIDWPDGIAKPLVSSVSTVTSDILPTLCKLAGTRFPDVPLDGIDLMPLLQGNMKQRRKPIAFWNFPTLTNQDSKPYIDPELQRGTTPLVKKSRGLFTRNFRNDHHPEITEDDFNGARAIISGDYKLVIDGDKNTGVELFNLRNDSAESNNLAGSQSVMVEKLKKEMRDWQASALYSLMEADYKSK